MAVSDPYATPALYRLIVSKSEAVEDALIEADLRAVSRYIDAEAGRFFSRDAAPVPRVYTVPDYGQGPPIDPFYITPFNTSGELGTLDVDDIATTTGLVVRTDLTDDGVFETVWAYGTDYRLEPENAALGPEPWPYTRLVVPSWSTRTGFVPGARVQVTACWGWPAVPDAVARATCHLAGVLRLESPRATNRVDEMGTVLSTSREARSIVRDLIKPYAKSAIVFA